jgi:hypothetical protein
VTPKFQADSKNKVHLCPYFIQYTKSFWYEDSSFFNRKFVVLVAAAVVVVVVVVAADM